MEGQAFVFEHPHYEDLRVIDTVEGLFYDLCDIIHVYGKSGKDVFETIADSKGRVAEFLIVGKYPRSKKTVNLTRIFVDAETLHDLEVGLNADQKLGKRWIHEFVEPIMQDAQLAEQYLSKDVVDVSCAPPTLAPMDIRYRQGIGLYINNHYMGK